MPEYSVCYESLSSRSNASAGLRPDGVAATQSIALTAFTAADLVLPRPLVPLSGYDGIPLSVAHAIELGDTDRGVRYILGDAATPTGYLAQDGAPVVNGQPYIIRHDNTTIQSGRVSPRLELTTDTQVANPTAIYLELSLAYKRNIYQGLHHFVEFEDRPPNTAANGATRLSALLRLIHDSGASYVCGLNASGQPITISNCGFSAVSPSGQLWIRPEDRGPGSDQIPTDADQNTASRFRCHPSVFFPSGKTAYVRALSRAWADSFALDDGITSEGPPMEIVRVDSAPTASTWLVSIDGQPQIVSLAHPAGSDYRRPRDIYNNVWNPIQKGGSSLQSQVSFPLINFLLGQQQAGATAYNWAYADYFRMIDISATTTIDTQAMIG